MIIEALIEFALSQGQKKIIRDVRAGLSYTCVMLEDGACGLAYTFRNEKRPAPVDKSGPSLPQSLTLIPL